MTPPRIQYTVYVMPADMPRTTQITLTHTRFGFSVANLAAMIQTDLFTDPHEAAAAVMGDGWQPVETMTRTQRYIRLTNDTAAFVGDCDIEIPDDTTVLYREVYGQPQYAIVKSRLLCSDVIHTTKRLT